MMQPLHKPRRSSARGFTLTELALVLFIVSAVVGAIWVAGQHVWDNYRVYRVFQQTMSSVQGIRDKYGNTLNVWAFAADSDQTSTFDAIGILPVEMRRTPGSAPGGSPRSCSRR